MPALSDILQFMRGQLLQTPALPEVDFAGKTVVVTGGNTGLGFECAKQLVRLNVSTLVLGCRSLSKGESAKKSILSSHHPGKPSPTEIRVWAVDMADYTSVKSFARRVGTELPRLDALLVNAGISTNEYHEAEGLEETLTVNVASAFLLALLCLPVLEQTSRLTDGPAHVSITGSVVHAFADPRDLVLPPEGEVFSTLSKKDKADMGGRYFLSKLIVLLCVREMSTRMTSNVVLNCPNPGWCKTTLFRHDDGGFVGRNMLRLIGRTAEVGARCLTSAIVAGKETHGEYLSEGRVKRSSVWVRSEEGGVVQKSVWSELLGILEGVSPGVGDGLSPL